MGFSKYTTRTINTPYKSSRNGVRITTIVLHHMASTSLDGVLSMWINATRQGSANYAIGNEGQVVGAVDESLRSWSLANAAFDSKSITFEIENEALGGSWPVSGAAHEATAKVVADICQRYGIAINRTNILGHREVYSRYGVGYSTACPGGLNMDWIVNRANQIASGTATPTEEKTEDMTQGIYTRIATGEGAGGIFYQDAPGAPLYGLGGTEWAAAASNGNKYANISAADFQALYRMVGSITTEAPYGRIVRNADGTPKIAFPG
jgi:hypothetical protein